MIEKRRGAAPVVGILCLALAVNGCLHRETADRGDSSGGEPTSASADGDNGNGTYTAPAVPSGPAVLIAQDQPYSAYNNNTAEMQSLANSQVLNQVLADPFVVDGDGTFLLNSDMMESAELTAQDPQVVTYRIKPDVTWSDGNPWDCDDFYLAWLAGSGRAVMHGPDGRPISDVEGEERAHFQPATTKGREWADGECRDDRTFVETYAAPYAEWRRNYINNAILPAHVIERVTGVQDITTLGPDSAQMDLQKVADAWNRGWLGFHAATMPASGPYLIESSQPGGRTVLVRNQQWRGHPGGPERLVFVPTDSAAAVRGLRNQDFTVLVLPADPVLVGRLGALSDQGVTVETRGGATTENLNLNLARPLFQDVGVRSALAQCIDRNELVEKLVRSVLPVAQPQGSLTFLPGDADYADRYADKMPADSREAQLTLERTGWVLGQDGVYSRKQQRLSFTLSHDGSPRHTRAVELVRTQCRQAGMEIVDGADPARFGEALVQGNFDVALTASPLIPSVSSLADRYGSAGGKNYQNYSNPAVDEALGVAEAEYVPSSRSAALVQADQLIADDLVSFPLYQVPIMWSYRSNIDNVFRHPLDGVTWNANEWQVN